MDKKAQAGIDAQAEFDKRTAMAMMRSLGAAGVELTNRELWLFLDLVFLPVDVAAEKNGISRDQAHVFKRAHRQEIERAKADKEKMLEYVLRDSTYSMWREAVRVFPKLEPHQKVRAALDGFRVLKEYQDKKPASRDGAVKPAEKTVTAEDSFLERFKRKPGEKPPVTKIEGAYWNKESKADDLPGADKRTVGNTEG